MYLSYGQYRHADSEASVSIDVQSVENEAGQPYLTRHTWSIQGMVQGDTTAEVAANLRALERAYAVWGLDMALTAADGTLCHALPSGGSFTGVKIVKPPHYPQGEGGELSTYRNYAIVATCDYPATGALDALKSFNETVSFSGGGPQRAVVELLNGPPQEQVLKLFTAYRCTQSGSAVGAFAYPPVPAPLFPGKEEVASVPPGNPQRGSPKLRNGRSVDFPVQWQYVYVSATPMFANPNAWPAGG